MWAKGKSGGLRGATNARRATSGPKRARTAPSLPRVRGAAPRGPAKEESGGESGAARRVWEAATRPSELSAALPLPVVSPRPTPLFPGSSSPRSRPLPARALRTLPSCPPRLAFLAVAVRAPALGATHSILWTCGTAFDRAMAARASAAAAEDALRALAETSPREYLRREAGRPILDLLYARCLDAGLVERPVDDGVGRLHAIFALATRAGMGALVLDYVAEVRSDRRAGEGGKGRKGCGRAERRSESGKGRRPCTCVARCSRANTPGDSPAGSGSRFLCSPCCVHRAVFDFSSRDTLSPSLPICFL